MTKLFIAALVATAALTARADDSAKADMHKAAKDAKMDAKDGANAVSDATCPMVNGKIDCAAKKAKHKAEKAAHDVQK